jgi:hypothetical protein
MADNNGEFTPEVEKDELPDQTIRRKSHLFSEKNQDLFLEIKNLEERYDFIITKTKDKSDKLIQDIQRENGEKYRNLLEEKKKIVEEKVRQIQQEIEAKLADVSKHHEEIIEEIKRVYQKSFKTLLDGAIMAFGFDF